MRRASGAVALCLALWGCSVRPSPPPEASGDAPAALLGAFVDDYGIRYTIAPDLWHQHPTARYRIARWTPEARTLLAQNDASNPADGGLWTRIDWVPLDGMAPYTWAFCLSVYDAPTPEAAMASGDVNPETPRTGCNGFPFSRMRRATPEDSVDTAAGY